MLFDYKEKTPTNQQTNKPVNKLICLSEANERTNEENKQSNQ